MLVGPLVTKAGGPEGPADPRAVLQSTLVPFSLRAGPGVLPASHWGERPALCQALEPWQNVPEQRQGFTLHVPPRDLVPLPPWGTFICSRPPHLRGSGHGGHLAALRTGQTDFHPGPLHSLCLPGRLLPGPRHGHPVLSWVSHPIHLLCSRTVSARVLVPLPGCVSLLSTLPPTPSTVF